MLILPAIDIRGGRCVRLFQGDYGRETVFGNDPAAMAERWLGEGAKALHLVDLDGARDGALTNCTAVLAILAKVRESGRAVLTEMGGGIRELASVETWLEAGVSRVVIGTAAVTNPELVTEASRCFPGRVWVGIDARGGKVAVRGWLEDTAVDAVTLAREMESRGAAGIIFTDIDRDGTGHGVAVESTARLAAALSIPVVASGGVDSLDDVRRLRAAESAGIEGVIVGRALYDGKVRLADLQSAGDCSPSVAPVSAAK